MLRQPTWESGSRRSDLPAMVVLCAMAALAAVPGTLWTQESGNGPRLERLERLDLPDDIARASDVRWLEDDEFLLGVIGRGLYSWSIGDEAGQLRVALEEPEAETYEIGDRTVVNSNRYERDYGRLAVSPDGMAFTDLFSGIHMATEDGIDSLAGLEHLGDLDRRGSLTAAVGLVRKDDDAWGPYAAWLIEDAGGGPRGLLPTRDEGQGLELCGDAELSVIRFIAADRLLVIPGAEAGVFVYDLEGALQHSLDAETFFAEDGCDVEVNQWGRSPLSDAYARADWLGPRRIIDEVVADGEGNVYFFVRYAADGSAEALAASDRKWLPGGVPFLVGFGAGVLNQQLIRDSVVASVPPPRGRVCWDLVHAHVDDLRTATMQLCVVESEFADTRLRADLRGSRAVILLRGGALHGGDVRAAEAFEARIRPPAGAEG